MSFWVLFVLQDYGYGSVKSTVSSSGRYSRVEAIDWSQNQSTSPPDSQTNGPIAGPGVDVGLVLKLQTKLKQIESEKGRLVRMVEDLERDHPEETIRTQDTFRVSTFFILT